MLLIDLIYNISLLLSLMVFYQVVVSRNKREKVSRKVILGVLLGAVAGYFLLFSTAIRQLNGHPGVRCRAGGAFVHAALVSVASQRGRVCDC